MLLYGSVARHAERPLDDVDPSDVDILILYALPASSLVASERSSGRADERALEMAIGTSAHEYLASQTAPRHLDIQVVRDTLHGASALYTATVAEDGVLLWHNGLLPPVLSDLLALSVQPDRLSSIDTSPTTQRPAEE